METLEQLKESRDALKARVKELREVLEQWSFHVDGCLALNSAYAESSCSCGYLKARAALAKG